MTRVWPFRPSVNTTPSPSVSCGYCGQPALLLHWQEPGYPYPADWGPAWKCEPCDAFIRCYKGTHKPLGSLADAETRQWRSSAHKALDALWKGGQRSRSSVYRWLAQSLGVPEEKAHIGHLDIAGCQRVIDLVRQQPPP